MQVGVSELSAQVDAYGLDLVALSEELSGPTSPAALLRELQRLKAMQWLTRARLVLVQNNLGLAQVDLLAARRVLVALQAELPTEEGAQIAQVIVRLDAALGYLPAAPVAAADELEGAWQLLVSDLSPAPAAVPAEETGPAATPEGGPTATPEAGPTAAPTLTNTPEASSTPAASPTPTPTPQA
jgi:hypothetical protein